MSIGLLGTWTLRETQGLLNLQQEADLAFRELGLQGRGLGFIALGLS